MSLPFYISDIKFCEALQNYFLDRYTPFREFSYYVDYGRLRWIIYKRVELLLEKGYNSFDEVPSSVLEVMVKEIMEAYRVATGVA